MAHQVKIAAIPAGSEGFTLPNGVNYTVVNTIVTLTDKQFSLIDLVDLTNGTLTDLGPVISAGHLVTVEGSLGSSNEGVDLGNGVTLLAGQSMIVDDDTFSRIAPHATSSGVLIDGGVIVAQQAHNAPRSVTAATTMVTLDSVLGANVAAGPFNITLPATPQVGYRYVVENIATTGANSATVVPNAGQGWANGGANVVLANGASRSFTFDGSAWWVSA